MGLYAMADLHIARGADKPMDVFGAAWTGYMEKIQKNCQSMLTQADTLLIPGDISWATYASGAVEDLRFIQQLPGRKIISKGNHDYWWTSASKLKTLKTQNELDSIEFLHNNFFVYENTAICGNRGWICSTAAADEKIYARELIRLRLSLEAATQAGYETKIVMTHYPPFTGAKTPLPDMLALLLEYRVSVCIYGHLHNISKQNAPQGTFSGIQFYLTAADFLAFKPLRLI